MNDYEIVDPDTGKMIVMSGAVPPSEDEIAQAFASVGEEADYDIPTVVQSLARENAETPSIDKRIEDRGTAYFKDRIDTWKKSSGLIRPALAGLSVAMVPQERTEAAVANAMLAVQKREGMDVVLDEFRKGANGEKLGQIGDVYRASGLPIISSEPVAATLGFLVSMISPMTLLLRGSKALQGLALRTDKKIIQAGQSLMRGADEAVTVIGRNVDKAYAPVNKIHVDGTKLINAFDDAPDLLIKQVEKELGRNIDDIAQNVTIEDVRKIKALVGELKPTSFGKSDAGLIQTIESKNISKTYANLKQLIHDKLKALGKAKESDALMSADEAFAETINASKYIKKAIVDKTLRKATKAGKVAKGLIASDDTSTRIALDTLRLAGGHAKKNVNKAIESLEAYNRHLAITGMAQSATKAAIYGGAAGAIGGKALQTVLPRD